MLGQYLIFVTDDYIDYDDLLLIIMIQLFSSQTQTNHLTANLF